MLITITVLGGIFASTALLGQTFLLQFLLLFLLVIGIALFLRLVDPLLFPVKWLIRKACQPWVTIVDNFGRKVNNRTKDDVSPTE